MFSPKIWGIIVAIVLARTLGTVVGFKTGGEKWCSSNVSQTTKNHDSGASKMEVLLTILFFEIFPV